MPYQQQPSLQWRFLSWLVKLGPVWKCKCHGTSNKLGLYFYLPRYAGNQQQQFRGNSIGGHVQGYLFRSLLLHRIAQRRRKLKGNSCCYYCSCNPGTVAFGRFHPVTGTDFRFICYYFAISGLPALSGHY